jgi:uncharacterized protein YneF (UPF0154 family)
MNYQCGIFYGKKLFNMKKFTSKNFSEFPPIDSNFIQIQFWQPYIARQIISDTIESSLASNWPRITKQNSKRIFAEMIEIAEKIKHTSDMLAASTAAGGRTPGNDIITPSHCTILQSDGYNRQSGV